MHSPIAVARTETAQSSATDAPAALHLAALKLRLNPSRQIVWVLCAGHLAAGVVCWMASIVWWLSLGLSVAVTASLAFSLHRAAHAWSAIDLRPDGSAAVADRQGRWREARVLGSTFVSPLLTILNLAVAGARLPRAVVIATDTLSAEEFRRMRIWLRWRAPRAEEAERDNRTSA